jgi:peptidoglycan lytic transglycosylase
MLVAVLAASGIYSVAQAQVPGDSSDQTALAVPRMGLRGAGGVGLPQPLSPGEAAQVRRVFALQASGSVTEAASETERLPSDLLLGTILADRYLRYHASGAELSAWLTRFGDQAEAPAIRGCSNA